ncbi:LLM class flavin-dependent oxidoreductase [Nonomuraea phyllanthi]|uniref:LLM class flavin-dependent oxidoreductase n=1 Tax=Nonomuraea phyllanthi TaxID=2219224 RepID=A0A5C4W1X3_9ACTN|nr:LLM class flavin-dependent oxidoreductase [Nonomuraea phyllanthi]KAB8191500.1 LLM class flavin-dependent oxidoreductase [Nonomuraea phyllanthi]
MFAITADVYLRPPSARHVRSTEPETLGEQLCDEQTGTVDSGDLWGSASLDIIVGPQRAPAGGQIPPKWVARPQSSTHGGLVKFGVEIPTCTAGMMHPVPFAGVNDVVDTAVEAEQLGYYDAGGNDHLSTMQFVRDAWQSPPDYFEPLVTFANIAARTSVIRLTTGIMVLPMRQPVLLAKQVATLDQLSGGRVILGVAVGGYRDEFESVMPDLKNANRAELTRECIEALRVLFEKPRSTYQGQYIRFEDVESYPKPVQAPLPIYSGGNVEGSIRRAAELCQGWLPAKMGPSAFREGRNKLDSFARRAGRDPATIATALQSIVCLGRTTEEARETFVNSSFDLFRKSLQGTMMKGVDIGTYMDINLVGTPDEVCAKVDAYREAGLDHLCSLLFVGNTMDEMRAQIRAFSRYVIAEFPGTGST